MNSKKGILHIVATPIGNLGDMTPRAVEVLQQADLILAEDTRRAGILLSHFSIRTRVWSCHEHNERKRLDATISRLQGGATVALISDAGTPLISDPGYVIVRVAREQGIVVTPIPGSCAVVAALSAAGLPTDRFTFEGFAPAKTKARRKYLERVSAQTATVVLYESSHRIIDCLTELVAVLPQGREVVMARELTKKFETFHTGSASEVLAQLLSDTDQQKGEFVIMIAGREDSDQLDQQASKLALLLADELPLKAACKLAAKWYGLKPNSIYKLARLHLRPTSGVAPR